MSKNWAAMDLTKVPNMVTATVPGPKSIEYHDRCAKYMKGYSSQVKLFPVAFDKGFGYTLTDVDGNTYLDFSSGISTSRATESISCAPSTRWPSSCPLTE